MKKIFFMTLAVLLLAAFSTQTFAQDLATSEDNMSKTGFFLGAGAVGGYEVNQIKRFAGGAATRIGYRFLEDLSVYLETDAIFTTKWGTMYTIVSTAATVSYSVYGDLYGYFGAGYELMHAAPGANIKGVNYNMSKNWSGWMASAGLGYDFWIKRVTISPEIGLSYARIAAASFYTPTIRAVACYHF